MGYPPRLCFDGAIYHVTARGDNREPIFLDDNDYQQYLLLLCCYKDQFHFILHAYALMPNHIHLVLAPAAGTTISHLMQCLAIRYTKYFNHRHQRVGHVFQGRFHSRLIDQERYLLVASRYVHRNPCKARLCLRPQDYAWSSYTAYLDRAADQICLVDPEMVLALMRGEERERQVENYRDFVETPDREEETWEPILSRPRGRPLKLKNGI